MSSSRPDRPVAEKRIDTIAGVLLALAAVATAWCSFQASRWNLEQVKASSTANSSRIHADRAAGLANAQSEVDVDLFTSWVDAHLQGEEEVADFYEERFRDEFQPAFRAWLRTDPFDDSSAPPSPFAMDEYVLAANQEADELEATAEAASAAKDVYIQRTANYMLGVVLFATALFFAGISTRLNGTRLRGAILGVGCVIFIAALSWIVTFPISLSV